MSQYKAWSIFLLCLLLLAGCTAQPPAEPTGTTGETIEQEVLTVLEYTAHYVRTDGFYYYEDGGYPCVFVVGSVEEGRAYYANQIPHDLEATGEPVASTGVLKSMVGQEYTEEFFESNYLVYVVLEEPSGSNRHEVKAVEQTADGKLQVSVDTIIPEVGTDDMAQWHIILELERNGELPSPEDILVYQDGQVTYDGKPVEQAQDVHILQSPPAATLFYAEGSASLPDGGYHWTYEKADGTGETTIADAMHPLDCQDLLKPIPTSAEYVKVDFEVHPNNMKVRCWPDTAWGITDTPSETVTTQDVVFDVKKGGYIYEITASWSKGDAPYHGTVSYYAYIVAGEEHTHQVAAEAQTVADPISGYCGNIQTTLYIGEKSYTFMYGHSVTLSDILVNLNYDPMKVCRCAPEYKVDTEFGTGYGINLTQGYARCEKGQADLTQEQIGQIQTIIEWAETTNCQY